MAALFGTQNRTAYHHLPPHFSYTAGLPPPPQEGSCPSLPRRTCLHRLLPLPPPPACLAGAPNHACNAVACCHAILIRTCCAATTDDCADAATPLRACWLPLHSRHTAAAPSLAWRRMPLYITDNRTAARGEIGIISGYGRLPSISSPTATALYPHLPLYHHYYITVQHMARHCYACCALPHSHGARHAHTSPLWFTSGPHTLGRCLLLPGRRHSCLDGISAP